MTDLTPILNELLKTQNSPPTLDPSLALQNIDEFLKEAYRIVSQGLFRTSCIALTQLQERTYSFSKLIPERYTASLPFNSSTTETDRPLIER